MEDIFIKNLPKLDLHGYDTESAKVATNDFINRNIIMQNSKIIIIHGNGTGLVKKAVHEVLNRNKKVTNYHTDNLNSGLTIVHLLVDNR